jgi:hypothetical protein
MSGPRRRMKSDMSDFASMNPREVRYVGNQLYQARGDLFAHVQAANQIWFGWIDKAYGLTVEDRLTEGVMEEDVLYIELLNRPGVRCDESEHRADGGRFHNWAESLVVVHLGALSEAPENPASLVAVESPIGEELMCEDPVAGDDVGATGPGNKFPCPIAHQGPILLLHSRVLVRISKGSVDGGQNGRRRRRGSRGDESEQVTR